MSDSFSHSALDLRQITLRPILPEEEDRWNALMREHYSVGYRGLVGESLKDIALSGSG